MTEVEWINACEGGYGIRPLRRLVISLWHGWRCFRAPGLRSRRLSVRLGHGVREGIESVREPWHADRLRTIQQETRP